MTCYLAGPLFGNEWTISHCQKCGGGRRDPNYAIKSPTCAKCPQPWPFLKSIEDAYAFFSKFGPIAENPFKPNLHLLNLNSIPQQNKTLTGHHTSSIIMDDLDGKAQSAAEQHIAPAKPPIDWFAINKEFSKP